MFLFNRFVLQFEHLLPSVEVNCRGVSLCCPVLCRLVHPVCSWSSWSQWLLVVHPTTAINTRPQGYCCWHVGCFYFGYWLLLLPRACHGCSRPFPPFSSNGSFLSFVLVSLFVSHSSSPSVFGLWLRFSFYPLSSASLGSSRTGTRP